MKLTKKETSDILRLCGVTDTSKLVEVAVRGAKDGDDDRGVYDDVLHSLSGADFETWTHNTNPSASFKRGLAELVPGLWSFAKGDHNISRPARKHAAFRQPDDTLFVVHRDGVGNERGWFAINHHRGGVNGTSSLGCQTNPVGVWADYQPWAYKRLSDSKRKPYLLIGVDQARKILAGTHLPQFRKDKTLYLVEKGAEAPTPPPAPVAPTTPWSVKLQDGSAYAGEVKVIAGRPSVRTRLFARSVDALDAREIEKTLAWDDEDLTLCGKKIDEVLVDKNGDSWAPVRELAEACGLGLDAANFIASVKAKA
jgi:hypothetical protein